MTQQLFALPAWRQAGTVFCFVSMRDEPDTTAILQQALVSGKRLCVPRCLPGVDARLFESRPVRFECRCSPERVAGMLRSLGEAEVREVLAEQGAVTVTCEFCHRPYRYDAVDVEQLFGAAASTAPGSGRVN